MGSPESNPQGRICKEEIDFIELIGLESLDNYFGRKVLPLILLLNVPEVDLVMGNRVHPSLIKNVMKHQSVVKAELARVMQVMKPNEKHEEHKSRQQKLDFPFSDAQVLLFL